MDTHRLLARWDGFCAPCATERPLLLTALGRHGLRAWLAGVGPEDRTLSYTCQVCGRVEHVPATEEEDAEHDATLLRWPDYVPVAPVVLEVPDAVEPTVAAQAVKAAVPAPREVVRTVTLPQQRSPHVRVVTGSRPVVTATDGRVLATVA